MGDQTSKKNEGILGNTPENTMAPQALRKAQSGKDEVHLLTTIHILSNS
jgi:hypothetical protein